MDDQEKRTEMPICSRLLPELHVLARDTRTLNSSRNMALERNKNESLEWSRYDGIRLT